MKYLGLWLTALLCTTVAPFTAQAAPLYQVTVLAGAGSAAYAINSSGQVVGALSVGTAGHAFYFDGIGVSDLGTLGGANSAAFGINDSGTVVGYSELGVNLFQAFRYAGGVLTALPAGLSDARAINNSGTIVGTGALPDGQGGFTTRAYTYAGGVVTDLGILPDNDGASSYGYGINDAGVAVGAVEVGGAPNRPTDPFRSSGGLMQNLGNFDGVFGAAHAVNDAGLVVGSAGALYLDDDNIYPEKAFLWNNGVLSALGEFKPNGNSVAFDINNAGLIVGRADAPAGTRGFVSTGVGLVALDSLIDPGAGWTITAANGINDLQQIAATACNLAGCFAVRLDLAPVPEPTETALLGAGLLVLGLPAMPALRRRVRTRAWQTR